MSEQQTQDVTPPDSSRDPRDDLKRLDQAPKPTEPVEQIKWVDITQVREKGFSRIE